MVTRLWFFWCPSHKWRVGIILLIVFQRLPIADSQDLSANGGEDGIGSGGIPFLGLAVADVDIGGALSQSGEFQTAALGIDDQVGMHGP